MITFKWTSAFQWLIAALALVPVLLFAYLGQFSRMIADDYCTTAIGQELGAWGGMLHWYHRWSGGYSNFFIKSAMAPLGVLGPRITPTLTIILWLVGLSWLVFQGLGCLKIGGSRRTFSVAISAFAVAAAIHAFYSPQSFYWYSASTQNTLPLALLTIYMALGLWLARRARGDIPPSLAVIAGGALCFISAGAAEVFVAFQATFLTLCLLAIFAFLPPSLRRPWVPVFAVGWLATLVSLVIQLNSPGVPIRAARIVERVGLPNREMPILASKTLNWIWDFIGHPQAFASFVMLMAVGLLVMLVKYKPQAALSTSKPIKLALPPLWFGLIFQFIWLPLLWLQTSEHPQLLGRFSIRYMMVISLNILLILGFLVVLWQRGRIQAQLQKQGRGLLTVGYAIAVLFIFVLLFLLAQIRNIGIDRRSATWLFTSLLALLVLLTWQLSSLLSSAAVRRFGLLALCSYGIGLACFAAIIFMAEFGVGYVNTRTLAPGAYLLVLPGLIWGAYIGWLLKQYPPSSQAGQAGIKLLKSGSFAIVLTIGMGIARGQTALAPDFQLYAREWDLRHQEIIARRDSGQTDIEIAPLSYDLADYLDVADFWQTCCCPEDYYDMDSIAVTDG